MIGKEDKRTSCCPFLQTIVSLTGCWTSAVLCSLSTCSVTKLFALLDFLPLFFWWGFFPALPRPHVNILVTFVCIAFLLCYCRRPWSLSLCSAAANVWKQRLSGWKLDTYHRNWISRSCIVTTWGFGDVSDPTSTVLPFWKPSVTLFICSNLRALANWLDNILSGMPVMSDGSYDIDNVDDICDTGPPSLALLV